MKTLNKFYLLTIFPLILGCEDQQDDKRYLRMTADAGRIQAQVVKVDEKRTIDFPYIANALFYFSLMKDPHFIIDKPIQMNYTPMPTGPVSQKSSFKTGDEGLLSKFGFTNRKTASLAEVEDLSCLHFTPEIRIGGAVVMFELVAGGGIHIGYPGGGGIGTKGGMGGSLNFELMRLSLILNTEDPLTNKPIAIDEGHSNEIKIDGSFDYMGYGGLDFFFKTPLFTVVVSALQKAITSLVETHQSRMGVTSWDDVWQSKIIFDSVIADGDTQIAMRGGWRSNIHKDDQFYVYNVHYKWTGESCNSPLDYSIAQPASPIAEIKIVEVGEDVSIGRVTAISQNDSIKAGAIVRVKSLNVPAKPE